MNGMDSLNCGTVQVVDAANFECWYHGFQFESAIG
jgi:hypothetical protein